MTDLDVTGIGNAIVDMIYRIDDEKIAGLGMPKATMTLIDEERSAELLRFLGTPLLQLSGGSAANTIAGLTSLGLKTGYIGKVRDDRLGTAFRDQMTSIGVRYHTHPAIGGPPTAHCLVCVTPDAQRTMNTHLGACVHLDVDDLDREMIQASRILYLEGYLFDLPHAQEAFRVAAQLAHQSGQKVALSLSDTFCVKRHRKAFIDLIQDHADILFANEDELKALTEIEDWDGAVAFISQKVGVAAITRGPLGSVIAGHGRLIPVPAAGLASVVDTTGAGDLYAAGVMFGVVTGRSLEECGWFGSLAAAEVISHYGGRPETPLKEYLASRRGEMPINVRHAQIQRSR